MRLPGMIRASRTLLLVLATTISIVATAGHAEPTRILLIGNSYLAYSGGVANYLAGMAAADPARAGDHAFVARTISNSRLDEHDVAAYLAEAGEYGFDLAILQEHSTSSQTAETRARFRAAARRISAMVRAAGASVALYMTPAYRPPHARASPTQTDELRQAYSAVGQDISAPVIPVGDAFAEAYRLQPDIGLHDGLDGSHPTAAGAFLAAATVYASLYGEPPPATRYDADGQIPADVATFLLKVASAAARPVFEPPFVKTN